jgi:hypothetical protein
VVYNGFGVGVGVAAAEDGTRTITVPSCPRRPGFATVSVVMTEPE